MSLFLAVAAATGHPRRISRIAAPAAGMSAWPAGGHAGRVDPRRCSLARRRAPEALALGRGTSAERTRWDVFAAGTARWRPARGAKRRSGGRGIAAAETPPPRRRTGRLRDPRTRRVAQSAAALVRSVSFLARVSECDDARAVPWRRRKRERETATSRMKTPRSRAACARSRRRRRLPCGREARRLDAGAAGVEEGPGKPPAALAAAPAAGGGGG